MPYFVGYDSLRTWRANIDDHYQVYAMLLREKRGSFAQMARAIATLAQPVDDEVHYFRASLGVSFLIAGEPDERAARSRAIADAGWALILAWLDEQGLKRVEAAVAVPADLKDSLLMGQVDDILAYDDDERGYSRIVDPI